MDLDALVRPLRADVTRGASALAGAAAGVLETAAERAPASSASELNDTLAALCFAVLDAQPAMAPLVALAREVLAAAEGAAALDEARREAARAAARFRGSLAARSAAVARRAAEHIPAGGPVLTLSASATVEAALLAAAGARPLHVICLESRPGNEGRSLAAALAAALAATPAAAPATTPAGGDGGHFSVTLAVDAALESLLPACAAVLMGADGVGDGGVVNKIGSAAAAHAAARCGVPVLVAADSTKLLPAGFPQPLSDDRPAEEVWTAPPGVTVWNRYFESFPVERVALLVTEDEALAPGDVLRRREALAVPPRLRAWAVARARSGAP